MTEMPKRLAERRDELKHEIWNRVQTCSTCVDKNLQNPDDNFHDGFNACWEELAKEIERYEEMEYRFSCYLDHTTQSMSKTNYTKEAMYEEYNHRVEVMIEDRIKDMVQDGELIRAEKFQPVVEALKDIARVGFGHQGIQEDYPDTNSQNYQLYKYYSELYFQHQEQARQALEKLNGHDA